MTDNEVMDGLQRVLDGVCAELSGGGSQVAKHDAVKDAIAHTIRLWNASTPARRESTIMPVQQLLRALLDGYRAT